MKQLLTFSLIIFGRLTNISKRKLSHRALIFSLDNTRYPEKWLELGAKVASQYSLRLVVFSNPKKSYLKLRKYSKVDKTRFTPRNANRIQLDNYLRKSIVGWWENSSRADTQDPILQAVPPHVRADFRNLVVKTRLKLMKLKPKVVAISNIADLEEFAVYASLHDLPDVSFITLPHSFLPMPQIMNAPLADSELTFLSRKIYANDTSTTNQVVLGRSMFTQEGENDKKRGDELRKESKLGAKARELSTQLQLAFFPSQAQWGLEATKHSVLSELTSLIEAVRSFIELFSFDLQCTVHLRPKTIFTSPSHYADLLQSVIVPGDSKIKVSIGRRDITLSNFLDNMDATIVLPDMSFGSAEVESILDGVAVLSLPSHSPIAGPDYLKIIDGVFSPPETLALNDCKSLNDLRKALGNLQVQQFDSLVTKNLVNLNDADAQATLSTLISNFRKCL